MNFEQAKAPYSPITITLETEMEARLLHRLIGATSHVQRVELLGRDYSYTNSGPEDVASREFTDLYHRLDRAVGE